MWIPLLHCHVTLFLISTLPYKTFVTIFASETSNLGRSHETDQVISSIFINAHESSPAKCTALFIPSKTLEKYSLLSRLITISFSMYVDVLNMPRDFEPTFHYRSHVKMTRPSCVLLWMTSESDHQLIGLIKTIDALKSLNKPFQPFPKLENDKFVFHLLRNERSEMIHRTRKIKFGVVIRQKAEDGHVEIIRVCGYCSGAITAMRKNKDWGTLFFDYTKNLQGETIRITLPSLGFRNAFTKDSVNGYKLKESAYGSVALLLARKLNFTAVHFESSNNGATGLRLKNGTWTGGTSDLIHDRADIAVSLIISLSRFYLIDYAFPLEYLTLTFTTAFPRKVRNWRAVLRPFSATLYAMILCSAVLFAVSFSIVIHISDRLRLSSTIPRSLSSKNFAGEVLGHNEHLSHLVKLEIDFLRNFPSSIIFLFATFCSQSMKSPTHTRLLSLLWLFVAIVMSTAYQSKVFYFMAFPPLETLPETYDQLANSDYKWTLWSGGGSSYSFFQKGTSPTYKKIFSLTETERDMTVCLKKGLRRKKACILYTEMAEFTIQSELSDRFGRSPIKIARQRTHPFIITVAVQKHSILRKSIDQFVQSVVEGDIFDRMVKSYMTARKMEKLATRVGAKCFDGKTNDKDMGNFAGAFYLVLAGWFLSSVMSVVEICYSHVISICRRRRNRLMAVQ